jgi:uncharacterized protein (DUF433 family)
MVIPIELEGVLRSDPEILGGTVCFAGTRVPVEILLDYISTGYSLDRFLRGYSSVRREQALAVLDWQAEQSKRAIGLELVA